jgi:ankyrin repeat protein
LIDYGADLEAKNNSQFTALHFGKSLKNKALLKIIIKFSFEFFYKACLYGNFEIIKYLLKKGAQLEALTENDKTPLHFGL